MQPSTLTTIALSFVLFFFQASALALPWGFFNSPVPARDAVADVQNAKRASHQPAAFPAIAPFPLKNGTTANEAPHGVRVARSTGTGAPSPTGY